MRRGITRRLTRLESQTTVSERRMWVIRKPNTMDVPEASSTLGIEPGDNDMVVALVDWGDTTEPYLAAVHEIR